MSPSLRGGDIVFQRAQRLPPGLTVLSVVKTSEEVNTVENPDAKLDVKKAMPELYAPRNRQFEFVDVPELTYLTADGHGDPDGEAFQRAIQSVYPVAFGVKFLSKRTLGRDYVVPPLEALWWSDDPSDFVSGKRHAWKWTLLSLLPPWLSGSEVGTVLADLEKRGRTPVTPVTVRTIAEGECLQVLHIGPFAAEGPLLSDLHNTVMPQLRRTFAGPHHEIYLSDFRKTAPERLRTILRQPVRPITR
jgi:hypothetical protein